MICAVVEPSDGKSPKQQRILRATQLEAPQHHSSEGQYLFATFLLLRTIRIRKEVQRNETVEIAWKSVCTPLCVAFAKAIMTEGFGPLSCANYEGAEQVTRGERKCSSTRKTSADELTGIAVSMAKEIAGPSNARDRQLSRTANMSQKVVKMVRGSFRKKSGKDPSTKLNKTAPAPLLAASQPKDH
jgi:hypothetical protein